MSMPIRRRARAGVRKGDVVVAIDEHRFDASFFRAVRVLAASAADITSSEAEPARQDEAIRFAQLRAVRRALQRMPDALPRAQQMTLAARWRCRRRNTRDADGGAAGEATGGYGVDLR